MAKRWTSTAMRSRLIRDRSQPLPTSSGRKTLRHSVAGLTLIYVNNSRRMEPGRYPITTTRCSPGMLSGAGRWALLDLSAAEGGALKLNRERIDLRTLAERAAD